MLKWLYLILIFFLIILVLINIEYFDATCDMIYDEIFVPIVNKLSNLLSIDECKSVID